MIQLKRLKLALFFCTALLTTRSYVAVAQEGALPPVNLGDTSFLDGIAGPGLLVEEFGQGVHDTRMEGPSGDTNIPGGMTTAVSLTHVAYITDRKVFGAWYGAEVVATAAYLHPGDTATTSGFGDVTIGPAILQWPTKKLFGRELDQRFVFDMDLPTGSYSAAARANVGANAWTVHPYYAFTYFPWRRVESSWRVHYLWNSVNGEPATSFGAANTQAGQAIHFNATSGYKVSNLFYVGANGYLLKQITDSKANGLPLAGSREQVGAVGPGAVFTFGKQFLFVNYYREFGAENSAFGNKLVLRYTRVFPKGH